MLAKDRCATNTDSNALKKREKAEINSGFPSTSEKGTQVRNTCNYSMDGDRGDMPGKEELPILRLDALVLLSSKAPKLSALSSFLSL